MGGRAWSDDDVAYIKANADAMTNREMASHLGRTELGVQLQVNRIGLKGENGRKKRRIDTYGAENKVSVGDPIGKLTVLSRYMKQTEDGQRFYCECRCECGNVIERAEKDLKDRDNHSCGCAKVEKAAARMRTHGRCDDPVYHHWTHMRVRCNNTSGEYYHRYGGRGITICDEWEDAGVFIEWAYANGYRKGLTLDRKDNDGNYTPSNCRWATLIEQANNRGNNRLLTIFDEIKSISEWSRDPRCATCEMTIRYRKKNMWSDYDAVTVPSGTRPHRGGSKKKSPAI